MIHQEIDNHQQLLALLHKTKQPNHYAFQGLDFTLSDIPLIDHVFIDCLFLGCVLPKSLDDKQLEKSLIFPALDVPFSTHPSTLYTRETLLNNYSVGQPDTYTKTLDDIVYQHYLDKGKEANSIHETLARRLHDHAITDALHDFLAAYNEKKVIAIMGGHGLLRSDPSYKEVVIISKTWLYGHEPPTPFASKIAKYFANSVREDGLLTIAKGGIIFSPGSAGTIQEIFQDATQNHYLSFGYASPMVFLNKDYWINERPVYPLLESLAAQGKYENLILSIYDDPNDVIKEIKKFTD